MGRVQRCNWYLFFIVLLCFIPLTNSLADEAPLEVAADGNVTINSALRLAPRSTPPASPLEGQIYYTDTKELLLFSNGAWNKVMFYSHNWVIGDWATCSAACAGGTQTRSVICQRSDGQQVPDSYCGVKPAVSQACNTQTCTVCMFNNTTSPFTSWGVFGTIGAFLYWGSDTLIAQIGVNETSFVTGGYIYTRGTYKHTNEYGGVAYEICRSPQ